MTDPFAWQRISGWLTLNEGLVLQDLARGKKVLELGAYCGRSTLCLAQTAALVVSADWHRGAREIGEKKSLPEYMANVQSRENVVPIVCRFEKLEHFLPQIFDLVFVDGQHDHISVIRDTNLAMQLVVPSGVIAWHDHCDPQHPGVERGVREFFDGVHGQVDYLAWRFMNVFCPLEVSPSVEQLASGGL
jgi:predicted O-methyltransferase YrrM